jgi:hypothetical protein
MERTTISESKIHTKPIGPFAMWNSTFASLVTPVQEGDIEELKRLVAGVDVGLLSVSDLFVGTSSPLRR